MIECLGCGSRYTGRTCPKCNAPANIEMPKTVSCSKCDYTTLRSYAPNFCPSCGERYLPADVIDINGPDLVEIRTTDDMKVVYFYVNGACVVRCRQIKKLKLIQES